MYDEMMLVSVNTQASEVLLSFTPRWPQITVLSQAGKKLQLAVATLETLHTGKVVG